MNNEWNTNETNPGEEERYHIPTNEENKVLETKENGNVIMGTIGAFCGALLGMGIWMLIYHLGYIAAICGIAIVGLASAGYLFLGKQMSRTGAIIVLVISVVMVYVANYMSWSLEIYLELKEYTDEIEFGDVAKHLSDIIKEADLYGSYMKDLVLGYLLTLIGAASTVSKMFKAAK